MRGRGVGRPFGFPDPYAGVGILYRVPGVGEILEPRERLERRRLALREPADSLRDQPAYGAGDESAYTRALGVAGLLSLPHSAQLLAPPVQRPALLEEETLSNLEHLPTLGERERQLDR